MSQLSAASDQAPSHQQAPMWPVPSECLEASTRFGSVQVVAAGPKDAPPMILLHAFGQNVSSWHANVAAWARHYRVYALDTTAKTWRSVRRRPQLAEWLGDVLDSLEIPTAVFVGHSEGAWIALNMAVNAPQRVHRLIMLAPAASFVPVTWRVGLRNMAARVLGLRPALCPDVYTNEELDRTMTQTYVLVGEDDKTQDLYRTCARVGRWLWHGWSETIADAGHAILADQPDVVSRKVLWYLTFEY